MDLGIRGGQPLHAPLRAGSSVLSLLRWHARASIWLLTRAAERFFPVNAVAACRMPR